MRAKNILIFKKKTRVYLLALLVGLLFSSRKLVELVMAVMKTKIVPSKIFLLFYKQWHALKKYYFKTLSDLIYKKGLAIGGVITILFFLALTENSMAESSKGQNFSQGTLSFNLTNLNSEEEIIEEGFPTVQDNKGPAKAETITQNITQTETNKDSPEESPTIAALDGSALIKPNVLDEARPSTRTKIEEYIVQPSDNISTIAQKFGVSINTILWANKLSYRSLIRVGKKLIIPPVTGVIHHVRRGDTVACLARIYKTDKEKIIKFNKLADGSDIRIGEKLIIPDGKIVYYRYSSSKSKKVRRTRMTTTATGRRSHKFPYGECTWYVAQKRVIPWGSDAKYWISQARRYGYSIGTEPKVGAVIVFKANKLRGWRGRRYGHVGYVEKITGNKVTFSETNFVGFHKFSRRTLNKNNYTILGYIY